MINKFYSKFCFFPCDIVYYCPVHSRGGYMAGNYTKSLYKDYEKLSDKYDKLSEEIKLYRNEHVLLEQETRLNRKLEQELEEKMLK